MDQPMLLALAVAVIVALVSAFLIRARMRRSEPATSPDESPFAVSTEGMKVCPKCGMGNLWTERRCSACGTALKG
jgi:ribosomal protein L32